MHACVRAMLAALTSGALLGCTSPAVRLTATAMPSPTQRATATPSPTQPATATPSPTQPATATPSAAQPQVEVLVEGLDTPWAIAFAPDGRMFVTERPGRIRIIRDGQLQPEPWLTLDVTESGEGGLLGLALDPEFARNGFVYVAYTYRTAEGGLQNRLARLREEAATGRGVPDRVLFDGVAAAEVHDGGRVKIGPDGKLFWTMGDADNPDRAQEVAAPNGKILRLNLDGTVPADNPFPGSPAYAYGLRNPQGLAWQPGSDRLYATEHGPSSPAFCCRDEVNLIEAGGNYGWPQVAGDEPREGFLPPVISSGTTETWAPSGATFVTGGPWAGSLLFAGLRSQTLFRLSFDPADPHRSAGLERLLVGQYGRLREVAEGPDGALYILTSNSDGRGVPRPGGDQVLRLTLP